MHIQDIYLKRAAWSVRIYHEAGYMDADEITDDLSKIGCNGSRLKDAKASLWRGTPNSGITYSNTDSRRTIMVIGTTTCGAEYWNSIDHEKNHLLQHISETDGLDPYGEEISYISGEFIRDIFNSPAKSLLCDCCRQKMLKGIRRF